MDTLTRVFYYLPKLKSFLANSTAFRDMSSVLRISVDIVATFLAKNVSASF